MIGLDMLGNFWSGFEKQAKDLNVRIEYQHPDTHFYKTKSGREVIHTSHDEISPVESEIIKKSIKDSPGNIPDMHTLHAFGPFGDVFHKDKKGNMFIWNHETDVSEPVKYSHTKAGGSEKKAGVADVAGKALKLIKDNPKSAIIGGAAAGGLGYHAQIGRAHV